MTKQSIISMMREAQAKGLKTFSTGEPCVRGHVCDRKVDRIARCIMCAKEDGVTKGKSRREVAPEELDRLLKLIPDNLHLITREEAREAGLTRYFTGTLCKEGHLDERLVSNYQCMTCIRIKKLRQSKSRKYYLPDPDEDGIIRNANPCNACGSTERYGSGLSRQCIMCVSRMAKEKTISPEKAKEYAKRNYKNNKHLFDMHSRMRKKGVRQATPKWLTKDHKKQIAEMYRTCPEGWEVDHVCPIAGANVSGLNVPWNLQHLTRKENRQKWNYFPWKQGDDVPAFVNLPR